MIAALAGLAPHLIEVEAAMREALAGSEPRVAALIADLGRFHGKMLRPSLALLVAECLGGATARHHRLGAALELIHTATLIHDDLIDDAGMRRGRVTAHVRFGNTSAVLLGDYFYTRAFTLVAGLGEVELIRHLCAATNIVCEGELHQQTVERDALLTEAEYERIIYGKTAALTELAGRFGALAGTPEQQAAAAAFGREAGLAFQIADDCLDFSGDPQKVGKTLATDLERGRITLPVIRVLAAEPGLAKTLLAATTPDAVAAARQLVVGRGGVASALATARAHIAAARGHLAHLPDTPSRAHLAELAEFIVAREF